MHANLCPLPLGLAVADKAMFNFSNQWLAGLQPQLLLETGPDGKILVSSRVVAGDVPTHANLVLHRQAEQAEDHVNPQPHPQAGEAGLRRRPRRHGPCQQRRRLRREAARAAAAAETAGKAVNNDEPVVKTANKAAKVVPPSVAEKVAQSPTQQLTQVAAAEAGPPLLHPIHNHPDQNFRSAPPDATARCVPHGSPPQFKKYTSYMDKEKQRWTSLFGD